MGTPFTPDELTFELSNQRLIELIDLMGSLTIKIEEDFPRNSFGFLVNASPKKANRWEEIIDGVDSLYREYGDLEYPGILDDIIAVLEDASDDEDTFFEPIESFKGELQIPCIYLTESLLDKADQVDFKYIEEDVGNVDCTEGVTDLYFNTQIDLDKFRVIFDQEYLRMFLLGLKLKELFPNNYIDIELCGGVWCEVFTSSVRIYPATYKPWAGSVKQIFQDWEEHDRQYLVERTGDEFPFIRSFSLDELTNLDTWVFLSKHGYYL